MEIKMFKNDTCEPFECQNENCLKMIQVGERFGEIIITIESIKSLYCIVLCEKCVNNLNPDDIKKNIISFIDSKESRSKRSNIMKKKRMDWCENCQHRYDDRSVCFMCLRDFIDNLDKIDKLPTYSEVI